MAQSPEQNASNSEIIRYDLGWTAINSLLRAGRSLSGHERNCCFLNLGPGNRFADVSAAAELDFLDDGRVLALSDWDYDGDVDFWIANRSGPQVRFVRNGAAGENHFIAFRLRGTTSNRDAIGARVTITLDQDTTPERRSRTLRAGDGYLSQSSKWLYFGLGKATQISDIHVHWPSGHKQRYGPLAADCWYRMTEGSASAAAWSPSTESWEPLAEATLQAPATSDQARIVLLAPIPLPTLSYTDAAGVDQSLSDTGGGPRLINLWASWCAPCLRELSVWRRDTTTLKQAGLTVVAVNLDEPGPQRKEKVQDVLNALELPFEQVTGTESLAVQFDVLQRSLLSLQRPLPLPSSFLVDGQGRLRVIYKGPVTTEQLISDAQLVEASPAEVLAAAIPFEGRWLHPPGGSTPLHLAVKFVEGGLNTQAREYLESVIDAGDKHPEYLSAGLLNLYGAILLDQQEFQQAAKAFARSLQLDPHNRQAQIELGTINLRFGKGREAANYFRAALQGNDHDPELHYQLGISELQRGELASARRHLERSIQLRPSANAQWQLANVHLQLRDPAAAILHYKRAIEMKPELVSSANNLAWLMATLDDDPLRNGERAVAIAEQLEGADAASIMDTRAAAYAETGRYADAVREARDAAEVARKQGREALATRIERRQRLYENRQPYRDSL